MQSPQPQQQVLQRRTQLQRALVHVQRPARVHLQQLICEALCAAFQLPEQRMCGMQRKDAAQQRELFVVARAQLRQNVLPKNRTQPCTSVKRVTDLQQRPQYVQQLCLLRSRDCEQLLRQHVRQQFSCAMQ